MIRKTNIHNVRQTLSQIGKTMYAQNNNKQFAFGSVLVSSILDTSTPLLLLTECVLFNVCFVKDIDACFPDTFFVGLHPGYIHFCGLFNFFSQKSCHSGDK